MRTDQGWSGCSASLVSAIWCIWHYELFMHWTLILSIYFMLLCLYLWYDLYNNNNSHTTHLSARKEEVFNNTTIQINNTDHFGLFNQLQVTTICKIQLYDGRRTLSYSTPFVWKDLPLRIHRISPTFWTIQIRPESLSVYSVLTYTIPLPPGDHHASDSDLCALIFCEF